MRIELYETSRYNYCLTNSVGANTRAQATDKLSNNSDSLRPMELLLSALASCSVIDLRTILEKQRQQFSKIKASVDGERDTDKIPSCFTRITIHYTIIGNIDEAKAKKAIELALFKYCSVQKHLAELAQIEYRITIEPS